MDAIIETATERDIPAIAALERVLFSVPWTEGMIRGEMENPLAQFLVLRCANSFVGYVGTQKIAGECYITNLAVQPEWQGRGNGNVLLAAAEQDALESGCFLVTLEVRESNAPALALYQKRGYRQVGRRPRYYDKPVEDALLMTKYMRAADAENEEA